MKKVLEALAHAADGACMVDAAQRIVFWNAAAERILGYRAEEVNGRLCCEIFCGKTRPGDLACTPDCAVRLAVTGDHLPPSYNLLSRTKPGATLLLNVSVIVPLASARPGVVIHLFRDVTRQLQYERYVEQIRHAGTHLPPPHFSPRLRR